MKLQSIGHEKPQFIQLPEEYSHPKNKPMYLLCQASTMANMYLTLLQKHAKTPV